MWKHGELSGFKWCIKVFEVGSEFGIDNGRISKLWIQRKSNGGDKQFNKVLTNVDKCDIIYS